jgi:hypothetical protein
VNVGSDFAASTNGASAGEHAGEDAPHGAAAGGLALVRSRPEVLVGAAFAGGMIAALLLRRLGR